MAGLQLETMKQASVTPQVAPTWQMETSLAAQTPVTLWHQRFTGGMPSLSGGMPTACLLMTTLGMFIPIQTIFPGMKHVSLLSRLGLLLAQIL